LETDAGLQVPLIPFVDVAGSVGAADPEHIGAMALNVGVTPAIVKFIQTAFAVLPQKSVTEPVAEVRHTW